MAASKEQAKEYQVKAVYLYNFSHFIHWPKNLLELKTEFNICVLGDNPFSSALDYVVSTEKFHGNPIKVHYLETVVDAHICQILFISQSERNQLNTILDYLDKQPVLTVSDIAEFIEHGGMIKFYMNRKHQVRLAIDPDTLREADLEADANLLRISQIMSRK
ncbi:YfiR family protein [Candidatus Albibeggiatoa sp. nov. BB20]|uniref:YfiR family protein n=1 Tax=Candidatus Albibeggiatoa sp. nov. BB20 TaxID=3162723 RepID=UPI003365723F